MTTFVFPSLFPSLPLCLPSSAFNQLRASIAADTGVCDTPGENPGWGTRGDLDREGGREGGRGVSLGRSRYGYPHHLSERRPWKGKREGRKEGKREGGREEGEEGGREDRKVLTEWECGPWTCPGVAFAASGRKKGDEVMEGIDGGRRGWRHERR